MVNNIPKKTKKEEEREQNRQAIYQLIRKNDFTSKKDLSTRLQLSLPTVNTHIQNLIDDGLIYANGMSVKTGGRNAQTYSALLQKKVAFGIELTSQHISIVLLDLRGNIIDYLHIRQTFILDDWYLKHLSDLLNDLITKNKISDEQILGVGIVLPALISEDGRSIPIGPILGISGTSIEVFEKYIPYTITLHNDCDAACFSEIWEDPDIDDCFFMMVGPYIGGSIIVNKSVYKGDSFRSAEIGHTTMVPDGLPCYCGKKGCLDAYCTTKNLTKYSNGELDDFFSHLHTKEEPYTGVWNRYLNYLAIGINNLRMLFNCKIIIGGYLANYLDEYLDDLKALTLEKNTFDKNADFLHISKFRYETFASGAALTFIDDYLQTI